MSEPHEPSDDRQQRLDALIAEYLDAASTGQPLDRQEWAARHPDLAEELARFLDNDERMRRLLGSEPEQETVTLDDKPVRPTLDDDPGPDAPGLAGGERVPGYEVLSELGRGGMGVVYRARQVALGRVVALKMLLHAAHGEPELSARFRAEAETLARLRHPGIVTIHEVGDVSGLPFISMEFCEGGDLTRRLNGTPLPPGEAASLVRSLAEAVQVAHEAKVLHRDLKPANVLLTGDGGLKITDFGLAKRMDEQSRTQTGAVVGTPSYMAPEQARGRKEVGVGVDVYSLGAILYECLTGRPPFKAATSAETLMQVLDEEPPAPRSLNAAVPRELEIICLKCLKKEPSKRYAGARELGEDLGRWLAGEPILARPAGRVERAVRWAWRRPTAAALLGVSCVALLALVGAFVGLAYNARLHTANLALTAAQIEAEAARRGEAEQRLKAERIGYVHSMFLAGAALNDNNVSLALERLLECKPELRNWEWRYLKAQCHPELYSVPGQLGVFSPAGDRVASIGPDGSIGVFDAWTGARLLQIGADTLVRPRALVFSPDGMRIAVQHNGFGGKAGTGAVGVYDARTGARRLEIKITMPAFTFSPVFSPDGTRIVVVEYQGAERQARVHDSRTGAELFKMPIGRGRPLFSPDGKRITVATDDGVLVYDAVSGKETSRWKAAGPVGPSAFSPGGARIAVVHPGNVVRLYDTITGKEDLQLKGTTGQDAPAFSPDGTRIAVVLGDWVQVYDARTGAELHQLNGPRGLVGVVYSPDGTQIAARSDTGVRVFDAWTGAEQLHLKRSRNRMRYPDQYSPDPQDYHRFSPDGTRILADCEGERIGVYAALRQATTYDLRVGSPLITPAFSPDGSRFAVGEGIRDMVRVFDSATGTEVTHLRGSYGATHPVFSPDGTLIATSPPSLGDGVARVYDARTGAEVHRFAGARPLDAVAFSPEGASIAVAGEDQVRVYDLRTKAEVRRFNGSTGYRRPSYSPDGKRIVVSGGAGEVLIYEARSDAPPLRIEGPNKLLDGALFTPGGTQVAAADGEGDVLFYDARTGAESRRLRGANAAGSPLISPDGSRVSVWCKDKQQRVYDADTGDLVLTLTSSPRTFSPDSTRLMNVAADGVVRLHDVSTGAEVQTLSGGKFACGFSPDGIRIAVQDVGRLRVYAAPPDAEAWQSQRRSALSAGAPAHHRTLATELESSGRWFAGPRHWQWFAVAWHWEQAARAEPGSGQPHFRRALALRQLGRVGDSEEAVKKALALRIGLTEADRIDAHAMLGQWDMAAGLAARAFAPSNPAGEVWGRHLLLRLKIGDHEGYRQACARVVATFGNSTLSQNQHFVVYACSLGPDPVPGLNSALGPVLSKVFPGQMYEIYDEGGAILYRLGRMEEAATALQRRVKFDRFEGQRAKTLLFLAMTQHRLGKAEDARKTLDEGVRVLKDKPPTAWQDQVRLDLLHREAEQLIKGAAGDGK